MEKRIRGELTEIDNNSEGSRNEVMQICKKKKTKTNETPKKNREEEKVIRKE